MHLILFFALMLITFYVYYILYIHLYLYYVCFKNIAKQNVNNSFVIVYILVSCMFEKKCKQFMCQCFCLRELKASSEIFICPSDRLSVNISCFLLYHNPNFIINWHKTSRVEWRKFKFLKIKSHVFSMGR